VNAIKKYLGPKDLLYVGKVQVKATDLGAVYQDALDTRASAVTAKGEYNGALAARDAAEAKRLGADQALEPYVLQRFGANSTEMHDFGFAPKKFAEKSAVTKAKATLLNKATRIARGTTSKKEKLKVKGSLSPEIAAALEGLMAQGQPTAASTAAAPAPSPSVSVSPPAPPSAAPSPLAPAVPGAATNGAAHN
jgi:hypothetical protein